jgi:hypothetical protein
MVGSVTGCLGSHDLEESHTRVMTVIHHEACSDLPPLPPARRQLGLHTFSHDERRRELFNERLTHGERRVASHYFLPIDPARFGRCHVGLANMAFAGVCGSLTGPHYRVSDLLPSAVVVKLPAPVRG